MKQSLMVSQKGKKVTGQQHKIKEIRSNNRCNRGFLRFQQSFRAVTLLFLFFTLFAMGGCDQAEDLATQALEKAKKDVASEITKSVGGGEDGEEKDSDKDADTEEEK